MENELRMPLQELLNRLRRRPFVPFRIHLTDGSSYEIRHPDLVMPGARSVAVGNPGADLPEDVYESIVIPAPVHITRLEPLVAPVAST
jgi:hypothetical protein